MCVKASVEDWMNEFGSAITGLCFEIYTHVIFTVKKNHVKLFPEQPAAGAYIAIYSIKHFLQ